MALMTCHVKVRSRRGRDGMDRIGIGLRCSWSGAWAQVLMVRCVCPGALGSGAVGAVTHSHEFLFAHLGLGLGEDGFLGALLLLRHQAVGLQVHLTRQAVAISESGRVAGPPAKALGDGSITRWLRDEVCYMCEVWCHNGVELYAG